MYKICNEDCLETMKKIYQSENKVDLILTSPPYNMTQRKGGYADTGRYDVYEDWKSEDEYLNWSVELFENFDKVLKDNKLVIYNFGYSIENPSLPYKLINKIEAETNFVLVDTIIWKKKSGLPFPANKYRLSRNWEYIWVFCKKDHIDNFDIFKPISSVSEKTKQIYYKVFYNFIEAKNNDGKTSFNQATFSSELVEYLLSIYADKNYLIYDPFNGTGTTGVAALKLGHRYIGSEISKKQCDFTIERLESIKISDETN